MRKIILLVLICLLLVTLWFGRGFLFAGGEEGIPFYNLVRYYKTISSVWYGYETGGLVIGFLPQIPYFYIMETLSLVGFSSLFLQALTFFVLMSAGVVSIYFLLKETILDTIQYKYKNLVPFIGGVFYLFNPFSLTQVWGRGLSPFFFSFSFVPLFLLLFVLTLRRNNVIYLLLAEIFGFIFSNTFSNPTQAIVVWFPVFVYLCFYIIFNRKDKKKTVLAIVYFVLFFALWLFIHSWWIIPNFSLGGSVYSVALDSTKVNVSFLEGLSRSYPLSVLIRLMHKGYFFEGAFYGDIYSTPYFFILSWLVPVVSLFSLSKLKTSSHFKFYVFLFLTALFVCLGANPPLGRVFVFFFSRIPPLQAFRNPFEKFGIVFLLSYIPFFSIGLITFSEKVFNFLKRRNIKVKSFFVLIALIFLINGVYIWPMWTGQFAGGFKFNPWVQVPEYYRQANDWFNSQTGDFRILHVPLLPGDGLKYNWDHPYQGVEPARFFFDRESISTQTGAHKTFYNILLKRFGGFQPNINGPDPDLSQSDFASRELYQELEKLDVRYIILHRDLITKISATTSVEDTEAYLREQPNIKKVRSFGDLDIYEVKIPDNISIVYSPQVDVKYTKVSSTLYNVHVKSEKDFDIYFLNFYHPGWELYLNGEKVNNHYEVFSYANAWKVQKKGDLNLTIRFKPQDSVGIWEERSLYIVLFLGALIGFYFIFRIKPRSS